MVATVPRGGHVVDDGVLFYAARREHHPPVSSDVLLFLDRRFFLFVMRIKNGLKTQSYIRVNVSKIKRKSLLNVN